MVFTYKSMKIDESIIKDYLNNELITYKNGLIGSQIFLSGLINKMYKKSEDYKELGAPYIIFHVFLKSEQQFNNKLLARVALKGLKGFMLDEGKQNFVYKVESIVDNSFSDAILNNYSKNVKAITELNLRLINPSKFFDVFKSLLTLETQLIIKKLICNILIAENNNMDYTTTFEKLNEVNENANNQNKVRNRKENEQENKSLNQEINFNNDEKELK